MARNPTTPSERLRKLAASLDDFVRRAVAANPNTPFETLWELANPFPREVHDNPGFSLGLLLHGESVLERREGEPSDVLPLIRIASGVVLDFLVNSQLPEVHQALLGRPDLPVEVFEKLAAESEANLLAAVQNDSAPQSVVRMAVFSANHMARARAARHPNCPPEWLTKLASDRHSTVLYAVAMNQRTPAEALARVNTYADPALKMILKSRTPYFQ